MKRKGRKKENKDFMVIIKNRKESSMSGRNILDGA